MKTIVFLIGHPHSGGAIHHTTKGRSMINLIGITSNRISTSTTTYFSCPLFHSPYSSLTSLSPPLVLLLITD